MYIFYWSKYWSKYFIGVLEQYFKYIWTIPRENGCIPLFLDLKHMYVIGFSIGML